jgi:predicted transcriptional regulator
MVTFSETKDRMKLSSQEYEILAALLAGPLSGYEIARQCEVDRGLEKGSVSNNGIQYSLKSLLQYYCVHKVDSATSRSGYYYQITDLGTMVIEGELRRLKQWARQVEDRRRT